MSYANTPVRAVGGRLVLDFLNTADWSDDGTVIHEKLCNIADITRWTDALDITRSLTDGCTHDLDALRHLRLELRRIFRSVLNGDAPDPRAIDQLNEIFASGTAAPRMTRLTERPWMIVESRLIDVILTSAKAVFFDPREIQRVNMCSGTDCGWLYIDESRNQQRKWCMMQTCGNRAKARRFYANKTSHTQA